MKVKYDYYFGLPRKIVWKYIKDEKVLRNSLPGCKSFIESSRGVYQAEFEINIGPIQDRLILEIRLVDERSPSFYQLVVQGKSTLGEIDAKAGINIIELQGESKLTISADAQLTGALALAGQRVLEGAANKGLEVFFRKMEKEIKMSLYKLKKRGR
ncbi:SRPBCC domain-containing protein [Neobacillus sp.]|uniref:CoxG family protein n=1 Tax=Neobacillus sp. TaxID=2675273 RepID=UPI00289F22A4|nr:SRPBCC domain-containing protein [Neobacillus sp.]